jgi:hypothetical protein
MNNNNIMQLKEVINFGKPVHKEDCFTYYLQNAEEVVKAMKDALDKGFEETWSILVFVQCQNNNDSSEIYNEYYKASFKPHKQWGLKGSFEIDSNAYAMWFKFERDA